MVLYRTFGGKARLMSERVGYADEASVTVRLMCVATARADAAAVVGGSWRDGRRSSEYCSYASFADTVQAAAAGLCWRGLRPRDVVGVIVPDAVGFALAVHAVRAAGGVPSPVDAALCAAESAGQLAESGARMVIASAPLAAVALAAADRSWVRQVFCFGEALGTTPFAELLGADIIRPPRGRPDDVALLPFSRGLDGRLRPVPVTNADFGRRLGVLGRRARLYETDVVLATPPVGDGLHYALLLDCALLHGATVVAAPVEDLPAAAARRAASVVIVPPDWRGDLGAQVRILRAGLWAEDGMALSALSGLAASGGKERLPAAPRPVGAAVATAVAACGTGRRRGRLGVAHRWGERPS
jgi:acyl-CoA synthetase (AMP-forming)/AMP-acid ligase II